MNTKTYFEDIGAWPRGNGKSIPMILIYSVGLILSLVLTFGEYSIAMHHTVSIQSVLISLIVLACVQFGVQVAFFLHLSGEASARERMVMLGFTTAIVLILVTGSVWIMVSLNNRMMPSTAQMEQYMNSQQGI